MAGFSTTIEVEGLDDARRVAQRVRNLGEDLRPLLEIAGSVLEASTARRFDEGVDPAGIPWVRSRRAERDNGKTLVDRGDLQDSLRHEVRAREVEIGFDDLNKEPGVVAALHFGSHRQTVVLAHDRTINEAFGIPLATPRVVRVRAHGRVTNLPPRHMVGINDDDRRELAEAWHLHLRSLFDAG